MRVASALGLLIGSKARNVSVVYTNDHSSS